MHLEGNKVIDEDRQGEAVMAEVPVISNGKKMYLESYGCAMNFSDSEIVASIMVGMGYETTKVIEEASVIFLNTCSIRDNAELRIWARLREIKKNKKRNDELIVGVLGCMAERLKDQLMEKEKLVDIVVGPDSYRDLPNLLATAESGQKAVNVLLSREETYAEISPVRLGSNGINGFISITRGCDNMCSFCVVPFTRGRERSRDPESIVNEAKQMFEAGYREVTLLGQNVDSYLFWGGGQKKDLDPEVVKLAMDHKLPEAEQKGFTTFADLMERVAQANSGLRVRFSTSNPRDMTDAVLHVMAKYDNICKYVHLPVQSGNSRVLDKMNRGYTREQYMDRIEAIRRILPGAGLSTDIITGFCSETEEEHQETLSLMAWSQFDYAYMFKYSERPGTLASRKYPDDIDEAVKSRRLSEIIELQSRLSHESNKKDIGKKSIVLVENFSKRSKDHMSGRNSENKVVIIPRKNHQPGDYVEVTIVDCTPATLIGE